MPARVFSLRCAFPIRALAVEHDRTVGALAFFETPVRPTMWQRVRHPSPQALPDQSFLRNNKPAVASVYGRVDVATRAELEDTLRRWTR